MPLSIEHPLDVEAVLFDLDGTLLDTVADLHAAVCGMLRDLGRPELPVEAIRSYVGRGMHNLVKRVLADSLDAIDDPTPAPEAAVESFSRHYARENGRHAQCYPGVVDGLKAGERIVVEGVQKAQAGVVVKPVVMPASKP